MHSHNSKFRSYRKMQNKIFLFKSIPQISSFLTQREMMQSASGVYFQRYFNLVICLWFVIHLFCTYLLLATTQANSPTIFKSWLLYYFYSFKLCFQSTFLIHIKTERKEQKFPIYLYAHTFVAFHIITLSPGWYVC